MYNEKLTKGEPVKDTKCITEEKPYAIFTIGGFINQCSVMLEEIDNL